MEVETLGVARSLGWKEHMRCTHCYRQQARSMRRCVYRKQLDLETLVSTRGPNFPLSRLESRLMCPACGSGRGTGMFEPPTNRQVRGVMSPHPTAQSSKPRTAICFKSVSRKHGA